MMLLVLATAVWVFSIGIESTLDTINARGVWSKISYIGILAIPPLWFLFSLEYSELRTKSFKILNWLIWILPAITLTLVFTNEYHNLIWTNFEPMGTNIEDGLIYHHGSFFPAHVLYTYFLFTLGTIILGKHFLQTSGKRKRQTLLIIMTVLLPWIANAIYVFVAPQLAEVELTPIAISVSFFILVFGVLRYQVLTVVPIAKEAVFTNVENAIIIMDKEGTVIDYNPQAKLLFKKMFAGTNLNEIEDEELLFLPEIAKGERKRRAYYHPGENRWFDAQIIPLKNEDGGLIGNMLYLHDVTKFKKNINRK